MGRLRIAFFPGIDVPVGHGWVPCHKIAGGHDVETEPGHVGTISGR